MPRQNSLFFSWDKVDDLPDLKRLRMLFDALPDEKIVEHLHRKRGRGRNDYPVWAMLRAVVAGIALGHVSIQSLVRELRRNPTLADICGFNPAPIEKVEKKLERAQGAVRAVFIKRPRRYAIPSAWNFSRFMGALAGAEEEHGLITEMFESMREDLFNLLPDFGKRLGYDGKAIRSNSTGRKNRKTGVASDTDADWGCHETASVDTRTGVVKKKKVWFGYGLHLIADTVYEIPVEFRVTAASRSEVKELEGMAGDLFGSWRSLGERCVEFSADRGLDSGSLKAWLWDEWEIRPLIDTRELWREEKSGGAYDPNEPIRRLVDPGVYDNIRYAEKGGVHCQCPKSGQWRKMAFWGFEKDRGSLKFRCPAKAYGLSCEGMEECLGYAGSRAEKYGRVVRVPLEVDRRVFTPTPNGSCSWKRGYGRRNAIERINSRIDMILTSRGITYGARGGLRPASRCRWP